ncbi:MAG: transcriptional regulator with XRE-family HTH domain [Vicingaceae bacterium]|jgi:transcriptional regulator with XRE-family HTH domain
MDLIERFRYVMKLNAMTASQFADEIGVQRSSVSHILSGRNKPSLEFIQKVINRFPKVDSTWLINGKTNVGTVPKEEVQKTEPQKTTELPAKSSEEVGQTETAELRPVSLPEGNKSIKKIVVFYSDGTFEELAS